MGIPGNLCRALTVKAGGTVAFAVHTAGNLLHAVDTQVTGRISAAYPCNLFDRMVTGDEVFSFGTKSIILSQQKIRQMNNFHTVDITGGELVKRYHIFRVMILDFKKICNLSVGFFG